MAFPRPSTTVLAIALLLVSCSGGTAATGSDAVTIATVAATPSPAATQFALASPTIVPAAIASPTAPAASPTGAVAAATPQPTATTAPAPVPTTVPQMQPAGQIQFDPPQLEQGGFTVAYLNESASSATLTFQNRQYPMLSEGGRWWAMLGVGVFTQPGQYSVSISYVAPGQTAPATVVASISVVDRDFPVEYIELTPGTAALLAPETVQNEINLRASIFAGFTTQRLWSGPFIRPSPAVVTSVFGEGRSYNGSPVTDYHRGTDFGAFTGDPIRASGAGRVVFAAELAVRGNSVIVDHGAGVFTGYHHLSQINVKEGDTITAGQTVGLAGMTGLAPAPHLHWEVVVRGVEVDGMLWLKGAAVGP